MLAIVFTVILLLSGLYTLNQGIRLLQNKEVMIGVKNNEKIFSTLSPQDKRLLGVLYTAVGGLFVVGLLLRVADVIPNSLYTGVFLIVIVFSFVGPRMLKRRSIQNQGNFNDLASPHLPE